MIAPETSRSGFQLSLSRKRSYSDPFLLCGRPDPRDRRAIHDPAVASFVPGAAAVEAAAIVPDHEIVIAPNVAMSVLGLSGGSGQLFEQRPAFFERHATDV